MSTATIFQYGSADPLPKQVQLRAGPLSAVFEDGDLRYIRLGNREIIRRIYAAVRDRNWGTVKPIYSNMQVRSGQDSFDISYDVTNIDPANSIDFAWHGAISGDSDGTIAFRMSGGARSTFLRNRIGFCVLHPIRECAGAACIIEKADGTEEHSHFPIPIAPVQPFVNMRAISHEVLPGLWAEVRFEGDIFEMEDQRAWIDASYKSYCTPLSLPFPTEIKQGTPVNQSITLTVHGEIPAASGAVSTSSRVTFTRLDKPPVPLPTIGLGSASHGQPLTAREIERLRALHLSHLRVDLHLDHPDFADRLRRAVHESNQIGVPLELALFLSENAEAELQELALLLLTLKPDIFAWLIFQTGLKTTTEPLIRLARKYLSEYDASVRFGGGTNVYFTELNRDRPTPETLPLLDFVNYSANPQVHAFDNGSLAETCEALTSTIVSARRFVGDKPLNMSPVTLKPRFNAVATGAEPPVLKGELPRQVDPRQMSLFGAAWTLCSLKHLVESGSVQSVTFYETTGWRGVMETEEGSPLPAKFPSIPGGVFPLYHVLRDMGELRNGLVHPIMSDATLRVDGLLVEKDSKLCLLLANWTVDEQPVHIAFGHNYTIRHLDDENVEAAMRSPEEHLAHKGKLSGADFKLAPFSIAHIDIT